MNPDSLAEALTSLLKRERSGFRQLTACQQLTGGANQQTWKISFADQEGDKQLALRRITVPPANQDPSSNEPIEARVLRLAADHGIPAPILIYVLQPKDGLGQGYLMEWLEGQTRGDRITHNSLFEEVRPQLAQQCGEILARIHQLPLCENALNQQLAEHPTEQLVRQTWDTYRELHLPKPMLDYTARWLLHNKPASRQHTLVHGDFRNGNLMVSEKCGIVGVLDWELAAIGNPVRDLGWLCVNSWRFGKPELAVGGFGDIDDLLAAYENAGGLKVSRDELNYWIIFGSFWWAVTCLRMARDYRNQPQLGLERPAIGRRSSEAQMDCVELLLPVTPGQPDPIEEEAPALDGAEDILASVKEFLSDTVREKTEGADRYLAQVASNALGIVERQLTLGPGLERAEQLRLQQILGSTDKLEALRWQLVTWLRDESRPLDDDGLPNHLRITVYGQLQIDQPTYRSS